MTAIRVCVFHKCTICRKETVVGSSWVKPRISQTNQKQMLLFRSLNAFFSAAVQFSINLTIAVCFFKSITLWSHLNCRHTQRHMLELPLSFCLLMQMGRLCGGDGGRMQGRILREKYIIDLGFSHFTLTRKCPKINSLQLFQRGAPLAQSFSALRKKWPRESKLDYLRSTNSTSETLEALYHSLCHYQNFYRWGKGASKRLHDLPTSTQQVKTVLSRGFVGKHELIFMLCHLLTV